MSIEELIAEHEIQLEWFPNILWVSSKKYKIDTIAINRLGVSNEQALNDGVSRLIRVVEITK